MKYGIILLLLLSLTGCGSQADIETEPAEIAEIEEGTETAVIAEDTETEETAESVPVEEQSVRQDTLTISPECKGAYTAELQRILADPGTAESGYFNTMEKGEDLCFGLAYLDEDDEPELIIVNGYDGSICRYTAEGITFIAEFAGVQPYSAYLPELYYVHSGNAFAALSHGTGYRGGENNHSLRCFEITDGQVGEPAVRMSYNRREAGTSLFYGWQDETVSYQYEAEEVSREEFLEKQEPLPLYDRKLTLVPITEENIEAVLAYDTLSNETGDFKKPLAAIAEEKEAQVPLNEAGQAYLDFLTGYAAAHDPSAWQMNLYPVTNDWYHDIVIFEQQEDDLMMHIYRYYDKAILYAGSVPLNDGYVSVSGSDPVLYVSSEFKAEDGVYGTVHEYIYLNTVSKTIAVFREQERLDGSGKDCFVKEADTFVPLTEEEYKIRREQQGDFGVGTYGFSAGGYTYTDDRAYRMSRSGSFTG